MKTANQEIRSNFKTLKIIHLALCAGVLMAYIFAGDLLRKLSNIAMGAEQFTYAVIPIAAGVLSHFMYKKLLENIDPGQSTAEKLALYQRANLVRWAILEAAAFIFLMVLPDYLFLGVPIILYMASLMPNEEKYNAEISKGTL